MFGVEQYLKALSVCASDRPVSVGMGGVLYGRIPSLALDRFAVREGIDGADEFDRFRRIVGRLDAEETERLNKEANKRA